MARFNLAPHPGGSPPAIRIEVGVSRRPGQFLLASFLVRGAIDALRWHGEGGTGRVDELWRHGCFEAFVALPDDRYVELNLAPAARWAAYRFDRYRSGMRDAEATIHRQDWLRRQLTPPRLEMHALWELPVEWASADWCIGLSAVIEEQGGAKSYWALRHGDGPPDFHDPDCFIATLPAPQRP